MSNYTKIICALILGICFVGSASAYTLPGSETYLGYLGNINMGHPDGSGGVNSAYIGTDFISSPGEQDNTFLSNPVSSFDPLNASDYPIPGYTSTTHWFKFSISLPGLLSDFIELGRYADATISFFHDSANWGDSPFVTVVRTDDHSFQQTSPSIFASGIWWMRVDGVAYNNTQVNYTVRLTSQSVPLPPAALLFISALAGFGVIGRKKGRTA